MKENDMDDFRKFSGSRIDNGKTVSFSVSQEEIEACGENAPTIRFLVEGLHTTYGPFAFYFEQYDNYDCNRIGDDLPEFYKSI